VVTLVGDRYFTFFYFTLRVLICDLILLVFIGLQVLVNPLFNEFQSFIRFYQVSLPHSSSLVINYSYEYWFACDLDACDLNQHVKQPTHIQGHIIDLFISSTEVPFYNVRVGDCVTDDFTKTSLIDYQALYGRNNKTIIKHHEFHKISMFLKMILKIHLLFLHQPVT
jgi:hypothetical protein